MIYKQILSIYSENAENITGLKITDDACKLIAFCSPSGGSGVTSVSAATALRYAAQGRRVLYLNLEPFGMSDVIFSAEGQFDMSDIIFSLKSKKTNLSMKLESCVKQDNRGVCFYSSTKQALDMLELRTEEAYRLITELQLTGSYEFIIADLVFRLTDDFLGFLKKFHAVVVTGTGSELSNSKIFRMYNALLIKENRDDATVLERMCLLYNKFSNKTSKAISGIEMKNIGGIPKFDQAKDIQVIEEIAKMAVLDKII